MTRSGRFGSRGGDAEAGIFGPFARFCLLGGTRRSEPTYLKWDEHVMPDRVLIDADTTKMARPHAIPRTRLVDEVLDDAKRYQRASGLIFPSPRDDTRLGDFTRRTDALIKQAGTAKWTMHDLRRTCRTVMSKCGYSNDIQRLAIGQKAPALDQLYNFDEQWALRRMCFAAAHAYIVAVIAGRNPDAVVKRERAANPENARKLELLGRLASLHLAA